MLASTMQFTTNPPTPPTQFLEEGVFGPGRTAPEPDSVPRPHNHRPPHDAGTVRSSRMRTNDCEEE